jgi:hypothetical protein
VVVCELPCDAFQELLLSVLLRLASIGGEKSSSISEILKLLFTLLLKSETGIMVFRIRKSCSYPNHHTTWKRLSRHPGHSSAINEKENIPICNKSVIFRLLLVTVFATGKTVTELNFQHLRIKQFGDSF